eukprot:Anaeramoba_ignava/a228419_79.p1 GENE.a228419_79~~a228419_79.p1  ORF type:complete len:474 (+),score=121.03 a228419_79:24-1424(+)
MEVEKGNDNMELEKDKDEFIGLSDSCFAWLPFEIQLQVFDSLTHQEVCRSSLACKEFQDISNDNFLWNHIYYRNYPPGPNIPLIDREIDAYDWKLKFARRFRSDYNIKKRKHISFQAFRPEKGYLIEKCDFQHELLAYTSDDNILSVHQLQRGKKNKLKEVFSKKETKSDWFHILKDSPTILIDTTENILTHIDITTGDVINTWEHVQPKLRADDNGNGKFALATQSILRLHDLKSKDCYLEFRMDKFSFDHPIDDLKWISEHLIFAKGSQNDQMKIMDIRKPSDVLFTFRPPTTVSSLMINDKKLEIGIGTATGGVIIYSAETGNEVLNLNSIHSSAVSDIIIEENNVFTCSADRRINAINISKKEVSHSLDNAHETSIWSLAYSDRKLVTGSEFAIKIYSTDNIYDDLQDTKLNHFGTQNLGSRQRRVLPRNPPRKGAVWLAYDNERIICNTSTVLYTYDYCGF